MRLSENRTIAWIVLVLCVLISVVGFGGMGLKNARAELLDIFYDGTEKGETARYSMDAYLDRAAECAQVMAFEAQLHLGNDHKTAQSILDALASFGDDDGLDVRYEAYLQLQKDSDALYNAFYAADLSDDQRVNFKTAYDDFWGSDKYIRKDPYRSMASDFNNDLRGFPASMVAGIFGIHELNSFGG